MSPQVGAGLVGAGAGGEPGYGRCRRAVRRRGRGRPARPGRQLPARASLLHRGGHPGPQDPHSRDYGALGQQDHQASPGVIGAGAARIEHEAGPHGGGREGQAAARPGGRPGQRPRRTGTNGRPSPDAARAGGMPAVSGPARRRSARPVPGLPARRVRPWSADRARTRPSALDDLLAVGVRRPQDPRPAAPAAISAPGPAIAGPPTGRNPRPRVTGLPAGSYTG